MRYLMLYKPDNWAPPTQEHLQKLGKFMEEMAKAGVLLSTEGLQPISKGARVRLSSGKVSVTDGPYIETKELIGGLAVIRAESKESAIEMTHQFLNVAGDGEVEIRELADMPG